jgi:outer membrane protein TolC
VKLNVFLEVKNAYYEYYYLARSITITQENLQLLQNAESIARERYKVAAGAHPDVIRAQVELGKLEDRLSTLRDLAQPIRARLNAAMNRPLDAELPLPGPLEPTEVSFDEERLLEHLEKSNPRLQALDYEARRHQKAAELAKKQYAPDITLGLGYTEVGSSEMASRFSDNGKDAVSGFLSLNIPIWHKKYDSAVHEARLERLATLRERTDTTNRLKAELQMALYRLRDAARKLDLYANALIPKATESLGVTEQAFRTGDAAFLDLIDAQRTYLEFELAYAEALAGHERALAAIEALVGADLSEFASAGRLGVSPQ